MAKTLTGIVSSDVADKTIVVTVSGRKTHPIYKKQYTTSTKFMAHDETNEAKLGDEVIISETRPLSARKRFILTKITKKALVSHQEEAFELPETKTKPVVKKASKTVTPEEADKPAEANAKEAKE